MAAVINRGQTSRLQCIQESAGVRALILGSPAFATDGYDPENGVWDFVRILVVGAGGIGSELLHLLALSGFADLTVIDLDTIELSNLNRQFLFRAQDIGKPKSVVAAQRVMERCPGVTVASVVGRIEEQSDEFYHGFDLIVMGLDSVAARRWMNRKVAQLAKWEIIPEGRGNSSGTNSGYGDSSPPTSRSLGSSHSVLRIVKAIPIIDTGTEGLQGHVKTIDMSLSDSSCLECQMWMYDNPRKQVPMCTLENVPRIPEHCVLYVQFHSWPMAHAEGGEQLDGDNMAHIHWVTERARERQRKFGIGGPPIDEAFTLGVVKNVVPAVSFTNAMMAGMAVTEILKWLTGVAPMLDNYHVYDGAACAVDVAVPGAMHLNAAPGCPVCGPRPVMPLRLDMTPVELRDAVAVLGCANGRSSLTVEAARSGTLSLQYASKASGKLEEVFLVFKKNSPFAVPIHGDTVGAILASSGAEDLLAKWTEGGPRGQSGVEAGVDANPTMVTAMLTAGRSGTVSVVVQCTP